MNLPSRNRYSSSEEFRDEFLKTLTPGIIPRSDFIHWGKITEKTNLYEKYFEFFRQVPHSSDLELRKELKDSLLADDSPYALIATAFQLLGHTNSTYASMEDFIDFKVLANAKKTEDLMEYIATLLVELGLRNALNRDLDDYFLGVQVGLETHRRKNVAGKEFINLVRIELERIVKSLQSKGQAWSLDEEQKVLYADGITSKKVDFLLERPGTKIGIEANFYTSSGSKPTEIKRSYGQVNMELDSAGAALVWITDGAGYLRMKKSLKEARDIHKNIYNLNMLRTHFESDLEKLS